MTQKMKGLTKFVGLVPNTHDNSELESILANMCYWLIIPIIFKQ